MGGPRAGRQEVAKAVRFCVVDGAWACMPSVRGRKQQVLRSVSTVLCRLPV